MTQHKFNKSEKDVLELLLKTPASVDLSAREIGESLQLEPEFVERTIIPALQKKAVPVQRWMSGWRIPRHLRSDLAP